MRTLIGPGHAVMSATRARGDIMETLLTAQRARREALGRLRDFDLSEPPMGDTQLDALCLRLWQGCHMAADRARLLEAIARCDAAVVRASAELELVGELFDGNGTVRIVCANDDLFPQGRLLPDRGA